MWFVSSALIFVLLCMAGGWLAFGLWLLCRWAVERIQTAWLRWRVRQLCGKRPNGFRL
jgi:hypothetical protein